MSPEPKIERYEVITPDSVVPDTYENIIVKTTTDTEVRVNKKHAHLHQMFYDAAEEGRALKIGYAVYMNREYVHTVEYFDGKPPEEDRIEPITAGVGKEPIGRADTKRTSSTNESIEAQVCLKCACEIAKESDTIETILMYAEKMRQWISSG